MDKLKKGLVGSILISMILAVTLTYVWATTPTTIFYISTGMYPGAPDYTVWMEVSGATFAKRFDGYIPSWSGSTNASYVITSALANASNSGTVKCVGQITCSYSVILTLNAGHNGMSLEFEWLNFNADVDGIIVQKGTSAYWYGAIKGRTLTYDIATYTHSLLKIINANDGKVEITNYIGTYSGTFGVGSVGVELLSDASGFILFSSYYLPRMVGFETGILLNSTGSYPSSFINANNFYDANIVMATGGKYGIRLTTAAGDVGGNHFTGITVNDCPVNCVAYSHDGTPTATCENYLLNFGTIDMAATSKDINVVNNCQVYVSSGELIHGNFSKSGNARIIFDHLYGFWNSGQASFNSNTSVTFAHGMSITPNRIWVSFSSTSVTGWTWTATTTEITITVAPSGTYTAYWEAEYQP